MLIDQDGNFNNANIESVVRNVLQYQVSCDYAASQPPLYTYYFTPQEVMSYLTIELYDNKKDSEDDYPMHVIATNNTPSECCKMTRDDIKRALNARIIARLTPSTSITYNDFAWVINHEIAHVRQNMNKLTMVI